MALSREIGDEATVLGGMEDRDVIAAPCRSVDMSIGRDGDTVREWAYGHSLNDTTCGQVDDGEGIAEIFGNIQRPAVWRERDARRITVPRAQSEHLSVSFAPASHE